MEVCFNYPAWGNQVWFVLGSVYIGLDNKYIYGSTLDFSGQFLNVSLKYKYYSNE